MNLLVEKPVIGHEPQYMNQFDEAGIVSAPVKATVAVEHALLSWLVLLVTVSDGAFGKTPQPSNASPPHRGA